MNRKWEKEMTNPKTVRRERSTPNEGRERNRKKSSNNKSMRKSILPIMEMRNTVDGEYCDAAFSMDGSISNAQECKAIQGCC